MCLANSSRRKLGWSRRQRGPGKKCCDRAVWESEDQESSSRCVKICSAKTCRDRKQAGLFPPLLYHVCFNSSVFLCWFGDIFVGNFQPLNHPAWKTPASMINKPFKMTNGDGLIPRRGLSLPSCWEDGCTSGRTKQPFPQGKTLWAQSLAPASHGGEDFLPVEWNLF